MTRSRNLSAFTLSACAFGMLLTAAAVLVKFMLLPEMTKLPTDFTADGILFGTVESHVPGGAVTTTSIEVEKSVYAENATNDATILVSTAKIFTIPRHPGEQPISVDTHTYAVDRRTLQQVAPYNGVTVEDQKGAMTYALRPDSATSTSTFYDTATRTAQPMRFDGTTTFHGRVADRYRIDSTGPLVDPGLLAKLRASLGARTGTDGTAVSKAALAALGFSPAAIDTAQENIPVTYQVRNQSELLIDTEFGLVLDIHTSATMFAEPQLSNTGPPPALIVSITKTASSDSLIATTVDRLKSGHRKLLIASSAPWITGTFGIAVVALAIIRARLRTAR